MGISMKDVKEIRERTGAGVLDCKKALEENDGDLEKAVEYLREKGIADAAKKAGRIAAQGMVNVMIESDKKKGIIVEVNSETDFVAKNEKFIKLVDEISEHILQSEADSVDELLNESWYKESSKDLNTVIKEAIASIGENINLRRFQKFETDGFLQDYIHMGGKIGVLVDMDGEANEENKRVAKDIAMHIAASNPEFLSQEDVSEEAITREKKIYREQMLNEGKPENIIDNIVEGKMGKYYTQVCLLEQPFVKDQDISVSEYLADTGLIVKRYIRYELGEGIDTGEQDFACEVRAELNKNK